MAIQNIKIKPNKTQIVPMSIYTEPEETFLCNSLGLFKPHLNEEYKIGEGVCRVLSKDLILVKATNTTHQEVITNKDQYMGNFSLSPLENVFLCSLSDESTTEKLQKIPRASVEIKHENQEGN